MTSRTKLKAVRVLVLAAIGVTLLAPSAQAAIVTVGSPLSAMFGTATFGGALTLANVSLPEPGAHVFSPVTGTIVRWRITQATGGPFKLRVLTPGGGTTYTGAGTSSPQTPSSTATQTFATSLPITAGQLVGLDVNNGDQLGSATGGTYVYWVPPLADGATATGSGPFSTEYGFNADVQPPPSIASVSPTSGPTSGGTAVTILGQNFLGTTSVTFGTRPAASFTVLADTVMTAVAPAESAGTVDIVVRNPGQSLLVAGDQFTFITPATPVKCMVPKLKSKKLKAAKAVLTAANCALGKVKKHGHKHGKVKKQSPKAGTVLAAGSKVGVTLGK